MTHRLSRRRFAGGSAGMMIAQAASPEGTSAQTPVSDPDITISFRDSGDPAPFHPEEFGIVGVYDADWLAHPEFDFLLDNMAASPRAFRGVRFFGALSAGEPERFLPESGGSVWADPEESINFTPTFDALEALTSRGLIPFIALGFFPPAISPSPIQPPADREGWKRLLREFFKELAADPRFGREAIADWWFEVWNEPNEGRFWTGTVEQYFELYRATSEVVNELDLSIRLGGPAIAYKPQQVPEFGAPWMERFLRFIASDLALKLDFVSLHRKGTVADDPPDPRRLYDAAKTTADQMLAIDPERFGGIPVINNEADEKVGFEVPYAPRMHEANAAWLASAAAIHAGLGAEYAERGIRFISAADNANLQLVEEPFDGRRSIMTLAGDGQVDLVKLPAYAFYELLPLLGYRQGRVVSGDNLLFPDSDVYHLATSSATHIGCLLANYPAPGDDGTTRQLECAIQDVPWARINVALFQIDRDHSNAYRAAGGSVANPFPVPESGVLGAIRWAQELTVARPIERNAALTDGTYREQVELPPYATACLWITPVEETAPATPEWIAVEQQGQDVVLRWTANQEPSFYSYEVFLMEDGERGSRLTPEPMRAALWVDTAPAPGARTYGVRAVSASGVESEMAISRSITITR